MLPHINLINDGLTLRVVLILMPIQVEPARSECCKDSSHSCPHNVNEDYKYYLSRRRYLLLPESGMRGFGRHTQVVAE